MIRLQNLSTKKFEFKLTKNPVKLPQQSPQPTGKLPEDAENSIEKETILNHPYYSECETVIVKPGLNELENDEQAEYIYMTLGNPEEAGSVPLGANRWQEIKNRNIIIEVDEKGKEIRDHFFAKYRNPLGAQTVKEVDNQLFNIQK